MRFEHRKAWTLVEMTVASAVLLIVFLVIVKFFTLSTKNVVDEQIKTDAFEELRQVFFNDIEPDLMEANEILDASQNRIIFIVDSNRMPQYDPQGDIDGDGIVNLMDPDDDNDSNLILPPTAQYQAGYDLKDDDEDGDKKIDMEVTFYLTGNTLFRDVSYNEEGFGNHIKKLLDNVTFLNFVYWGSKKEDLGKNIDLGNDGIAGTDDEGEDDGLISETEIDMVAPPTGHGNQNGSIDTEEERMYIASIYLEIGYDKNGDGVEDARLKTELSPPLLVLKNKQ
ncbi:MAG: hypothetical protein J7L42_07035 [Elusimicrobia bacterium]|nr:hypothetical protein [Elusimicrobiota bacterium]